MQRIHRDTTWYRQYLYPNQPSTKYHLSILMFATSSLPIMVLFQSIFGRFEVVSSIVTLIATLIGGISIRVIQQQRAAPLTILSGLLAVLYTFIGTLRWGVTPTYLDFWGGALSFALSMILIISTVTIWLPNHTRTELPASLHALDYGGVTLLMVMSIAIRWYQIEILPAATNIEAQHSLYALSMWQQSSTNPIALTSNMTSQLIGMLHGLSMQLFGETIRGARNFSVIVGSLAVVMTFFATRMFFDTRTAWFTSIVLLAMSSHVEFSRLALPVIVDTVLVSSILFALASAWGSGQRRWYMGAGVLLSLTQYTYHTGKIIPVIFAIWLCVYAIRYWQDVESRLIQLTSMWGIALVGAIPHWWSIMQQWDVYIATLSRISIFGTNNTTGATWLTEIAATKNAPDWQIIAYAVRDAAAGFIAVPLRDQYEIGMAMLSIPAAVVFVFGLLIMAKEYSDPRHWLIFIGLMSAVSIAAITINTPAAQRMIYTAPFVAIVIGIGIAEMGRWFKIDWIQQDWNINPLIIHALSLVIAFGIAGYDGQAYLGTTRNGLTNPVDQSANAISMYAKNYPAGSTMYLFTQPQLYYHESALLQFQLPQVKGVDVYPPLTSTPDWQLTGSTTLFVFNQERLSELSYIRQFYPGGRESREYTANGQILLLFYEVSGINQLSVP